MGGRWEFPGGKVEEGETDEESVIREFNEEFGVEVNVGQKIAEATFKHNGDDFTLSAYLVHLPHNGLTKKIRSYRTFRIPLGRARRNSLLNFVDSDMLIYPQVCKFLASSL